MIGALLFLAGILGGGVVVAGAIAYWGRAV